MGHLSVLPNSGINVSFVYTNQNYVSAFCSPKISALDTVCDGRGRKEEEQTAIEKWREPEPLCFTSHAPLLAMSSHQRPQAIP